MNKKFPPHAWRLINVLMASCTAILGGVGLTTQETFTQTIPWLYFGFHPSLRLDPLSSFFILLLGLSYLGISIFSVGYFKFYTPLQQKKIQFFEALFVLAMLLVLIANDPFVFLFAFELMTFSSYFLVVGIELQKNTRKAGLLYLGMAHVGLMAIAVAFFLLFEGTDSSTWQFDHLGITAPHAPIAGSIIFILALMGFGTKIGIYPLHVWLPEAHPAAPSPISALMSGVMLKTAIYSLLRFIFVFLLPYQKPWWGYTLIFLGLTTMFMGVCLAALQTHIKRLLAYSSIENCGWIATALGLAVIFYQYAQTALATVALLVVLLHSLNHSLFKSLLFLCSGSILHYTGENNLTKLGGLIHKMPWVSVCALIGSLSAAGLPLFNGFVGEWLYLGLFFHHPITPHFTLAIATPLMIAVNVLVFALAGFVMVKFYGLAFLGQPRAAPQGDRHPPTFFEKLGLAWLSLLCIILGCFPNGILARLQDLTLSLLPTLRPAIVIQHAFTIHFITPDPLTSSGLNLLLLGSTIGILLLLTFFILRIVSPFAPKRSISWGCGFKEITSRMQDTAEGFSQPLKQIFSNLVLIKLQVPPVESEKPHYHSQVTEKIWPMLYLPLYHSISRLATLTKWMQQGRVSIYLLYIGITLMILLTWVVWSS